MSETHEQIVKVWIAPGCIVCDACESDCPEVFEVQEETCIIRPEAVSADFTKPLTPSIITAAEGCPVEVIKFETITVDGPEPWAGQEEEAASAGPAAGGGGGAQKKAGWAPPEGPPDPKWSSLLSAAHTSGSRSAGGPAVAVRTAKAPAEAVAAVLPDDAPPDAIDSALVGSGFARPRQTATEKIRKKSKQTVNRRQFDLVLVVGWGALAATIAQSLGLMQAFLIPRLTKEPPSIFRAGKLSDYPEPGVYTNYKADKGVWIVHQDSGELVAISTTCTHLGCIPNWIGAATEGKFKCPCHGSGFTVEGINFEGPAPRPLERLAISLDGDAVIVDKAKIYRQELGQWEDSASKVIL